MWPMGLLFLVFDIWLVLFQASDFFSEKLVNVRQNGCWKIESYDSVFDDALYCGPFVI